MDEDGATDSNIWPANPGCPPHVIALLGVHPHGAVHLAHLASFPLDPGIRAVRIPTCFGDTYYRSGPDEVGDRCHKYGHRRQRHHF